MFLMWLPASVSVAVVVWDSNEKKKAQETNMHSTSSSDSESDGKEVSHLDELRMALQTFEQTLSTGQPPPHPTPPPTAGSALIEAAFDPPMDVAEARELQHYWTERQLPGYVEEASPDTKSSILPPSDRVTSVSLSSTTTMLRRLKMLQRMGQIEEAAAHLTEPEFQPGLGEDLDDGLEELMQREEEEMDEEEFWEEHWEGAQQGVRQVAPRGPARRAACVYSSHSHMSNESECRCRDRQAALARAPASSSSSSTSSRPSDTRNMHDKDLL
eukprot:g48489.t1